MITVTNLTKNFTQRTIFKDVSLSIFPNEKIGLTGPNGAGKSTLFSIILGEMEPTGGSVQIQKNIHIGYLPQEVHFDSQWTILEEVIKGDARMIALTKEKKELEDSGKADTLRYGDVLHELEQLGIYDLEHKAKKVLSGLGFKEEDFGRPISNLSGGWRMRALLAKLLTYKNDILLLDEPTNYLDLEATLWLKDYLSKYKGTFVIISHDKVFLNEVTNYTIVLDNTQMTKVKGNYQAYELNKDVMLKTLEKKQRVVEKKREQLERFTQRFHAQPNLAAAVRNKRKMIERLEEIELPQERKSIKDFEFPQTVRSGYVVASLKDVGKSYGDKVVYRDLNFEITRGQKICLVGPNGAGKSTLMKMLADVVQPDSGKRALGHQVEMGYFSQTRLDVLNPERTVFEEVSSAASGSIPAVQVRSLLGLFNFHNDDVFKYVKVLSGGEKSRLILAKLLIRPPNFMLLDEPTTHLDIDGVEALTKAFKAYQGTLCFISHDLFFVKEIADMIIEVNQGQLKTYPGGLDYYLDKKAGLDLEDKKTKAAEKSALYRHGENAAKRKIPKEPLAETGLHQQHQRALKRIAEIKTEIASLEREKKDLETENYVKVRMMSQSLNQRDSQTLKEYGQRLKAITMRLREIEAGIQKLNEEKKRINK
ncbi:MAG: ABC-F family ATP-binding cassette domain-containing protein [Candidatus Omnitrophota bacterium]